MIVGTIEQIWRYPVKSMAGETVSSAHIVSQGLAGDRCWAVVDDNGDQVRGAKSWPELLNFRARLDVDKDPDQLAYDDDVPDAKIEAANGVEFMARDVNSADLLSRVLGKSAYLAPLAPPERGQHYKLGNPPSEEEFRGQMGLLEDEGMPDFSSIPEEILLQLAEHATPLGAYYDVFPLHLMTTNSLDYLRQKGEVNAVVERFRPSILVRPVEISVAMTENHWIGKSLQIGDCLLKVESRTVRCSMPARGQYWAGLEADRGMTRAMIEHCQRHLGVNILVERAGVVRAGDAVTLID
jgi:uncharacterized protein YcbX